MPLIHSFRSASHCTIINVQDLTPLARSTKRVLLAAIIFPSLLCVACSGNPPNAAAVIDGRVDLTGWEPAEGELHELSGQWRFCPNRIIAPELAGTEQIATLCPETSAIPDQWEQGAPRLENGSLGVATYLLDVSGLTLSSAAELG